MGKLFYNVIFAINSYIQLWTLFVGYYFELKAKRFCYF